MKNLHFSNTKINSGFWDFYQKLNREKTIWAVKDRFAETGRFDAFRCDWQEGMPNKPHVFWDSDVVKWIEGVAYLIERSPMPELEAFVDEIIDNLAKNQREDGYYNSYFLAVEPDAIFTRRAAHELYCLGHTIEAAIAYHKATGKDKLLNCVLRYVDLVYRVFLQERSAAFVTPGHQEIELALLKLYDYLGDEKHLELARFFIDERGHHPDTDFDKRLSDHAQDVVPPREQTEPVGHAVRAGYMYTAMAMLAKADGDSKLLQTCKDIYENIITKKMSITGGIGATHLEEAFSYPYDIPNQSGYNETCASIALAMFASALQEIEADSKYGDLIERIYFNGFISGVSLNGDNFFYANPLELDQKKRTRIGEHHPRATRVNVFSCSCCPPNVVRMLSSIPRYAYTIDGNHLYCNQFMDSTTTFEADGKPAHLTLKTRYPIDGKLEFSYTGAPITLHVRIPDWCVEYNSPIQNGFAVFQLTDGDSITVDLPMEVHFLEANPNVQDDSGRYAVQRGPIVYCMEEIDNGENLRDVTLLENSEMRVVMEESIPAPVIYIGAERRPSTTALYRLKTNQRIAFTARLIPYFAFANREITDMLLWTMLQ